MPYPFDGAANSHGQPARRQVDDTEKFNAFFFYDDFGRSSQPKLRQATLVSAALGPVHVAEEDAPP
jgi:hypothetical protein